MFGRARLPLARREPQQLARRAARLRRGLAQQPPRLPGLGAPRPRAAGSSTSRWLVIRGLERLGLAWDVRRPTREQLERRRLAARAAPEPTQAAWKRASSAATSRAQRLARGSGTGRPARRPQRDAVEPPRISVYVAVDAERAARARSPRRECVGLTPGMPGSQRSRSRGHVETLADERREVEPVGEPRREPEHARRRSGARQRRIETAPPIENPTQQRRARRRPRRARPARPRCTMSRRFHDLIR